MELEQLRQVEAIERTGTMSAAAAELHISQPALSRSIQRLEAELGVALFDRAGRRVTLNDVGACAVEWARQILRDERLMRESIDAVARRQRTLRIVTVAPAPLWHLTALLVERFPGETATSETLEESQVEQAILDGGADLGIVLDPPTSPLVRSCELMREHLSVMLPPSHPLAGRRSLRLHELDGDTFLILTNIGFWRQRVDGVLPHSTFIEYDDREVFTRLARSTPHCTFTTDAPFLADPNPGRAVVPIADESAHAVFHLVVRADASPTVAELFRWVQETA